MHTRFFEGKLGEGRPLGRTRVRWNCGVKTNMKEIGYEGMDCISVRTGTSSGLL